MEKGDPVAQFHHPYYFVPSKKLDANDSSTAPLSTLGGGVYTHDRYAPGEEVFSGRLVLGIEAETPFVVGGEQTRRDQEAAVIEPFRLGGRIAIPGTSIRGMVSSLLEAATNSALRVLSDEQYSRRARAEEAADRMDGIGIVLERKENGKKVRVVMPLAACAPTFDQSQSAAVLPASLVPLARQLALPVYLDGYSHNRRENAVQIQSGSFLERRAGSHSFNADNFEEFWYIKLVGTLSGRASGHSAVLVVSNASENAFKIKDAGRVRFALGQRSDGDPISQAEFDSLSQEKQQQYTRGIIRCLGVAGRESEMPPTKKHEMFIPFPKRAFSENDSEAFLDLDAEHAIREFELLADQRTDACDANTPPDALLPYHLKGSRRNDNPNRADRRMRLRGGDIVFFKAEAARNGDRPRISAVSVSSIWRRPLHRTHDYFAGVGTHLLPLGGRLRGSAPDGSTPVTLGERLFGFVEQRVRREAGVSVEEPNHPTFAFASRLRFSNAVPVGPTLPSLRSQVTLKILASPKPPCAPLYFGAGTYLPKHKLADVAASKPNGRKVYIHHRVMPGAQPWASTVLDPKLDRMKARVTPVDSGARFACHIDFDNLTREEIEALCFALRPSPEFRHKIGMGRPLGLGTIRIEPLALCRIKRGARYATDDIGASGRYHDRWVNAESDLFKDVSKEYAAEAAPSASSPGYSFDDLAGAHRERLRGLYPDILKAIDAVGNPASVTAAPVHYPTSEGQGSENEHFKWFVSNDHRNVQRPQALAVPGAGAAALPLLAQHPDPEQLRGR